MGESRSWRLVRGAFFGATLAGALLFVGFAGTDLARPLGNWICAFLGVSPTVLFWTSFFMLMLLHFARQKSLDDSRREDQERLENAATHLEILVRTQPPAEFQKQLGVHVEKALVLFRNAHSVEDVLAAISTVVEGVALLAALFDQGKDNEATYAANLMIFVPSTADGAQAWFDHVRFHPQEVPLSGVRGLMALSPRFSASAKSGAQQAVAPDPMMRALSLPVPIDPGTERDDQGNGGWHVLPGAPRAMVCGGTEHFAPATDIAIWCRDHGDITRRIRAQISDYFRTADHIRGFAATPLFEPTAVFDEEEERKVVAVLNVHWSKANLLEQLDPAKAFAEAIFPLRALIAEQLLKLEREGWSFLPGENENSHS